MPQKAAPSPTVAAAHSTIEDALALIVGTVLISFALALFKQAGIVTGSTAGLAFLIHYSVGLPFGLCFFLLNVPFYLLAYFRMGWPFTIKTMLAVGLVAVMADLHAWFLHTVGLEVFYVGPMGGVIMGVGFLVLFRHRSSLGGVNILALYIQQRWGLAAGKFQMGVDLCIMALSFLVIDARAVAASVLGVIVLNLIITMNHRPDRYIAR